ncbi:MAG: DUF2284 domain-containing protein, partial [Deltaproteobacteria bacterium]|nr:DUF2284 domain-containing protein [Deltaproteobacteria bacterium]
IEVAEWVRLKCHYGCSRFDSNWTCPPATPGPDKVRAILDEYELALLLVGTKNCSDFYLNNGRKRFSQVRCWKGTISLERMLFLEGYYKAFSLVGDCCALCKECAYPEDCRFPQEKRPSGRLPVPPGKKAVGGIIFNRCHRNFEKSRQNLKNCHPDR